MTKRTKRLSARANAVTFGTVAVVLCAVNFVQPSRATTRPLEQPESPNTSLQVGSPADDQRDAIESKLSTVAAAIEKIGATVDVASFDGVSIDADHGSLAVYRRGGEVVSDSLRASYASATPVGVPLSYFPSELTRALRYQALQYFLSLDDTADGSALVSVGQRDGFGTGLVVTYKSGYDLPSTVRSTFTKIAGSAVAFVSGGNGGPLSGRNLDTPQFYGGAGIRSANTGGQVSACSSGFSAHNDSNNHDYILTAWHCYNPYDNTMIATWAYTGGNQQGDVAAIDTGSDSAFYDTTDHGGSAPYLYSGSFGDTSTHINVNTVQTSSPQSGQSVCVAGATTGAKCAAHVVGDCLNAWSVYNDFGSSPKSVTGCRANKDTSTTLAGAGDSGGPVYSKSSAGARAIGIVSASPDNVEVACPSDLSRPLGQTRCFSSIYFSSLDNIMQPRSAALHISTF